MSHPTLSPRAALWLQASMIVSFIAGSSAPTPLYPVYQAAWGITPATVTAIFAVYAIAVLATLLVTGSLSDHVGRRPVLVVASIVQIIAMVGFATAGDVAQLVAARIVQGIATGGAAAAVGAGMIDIDRARGTIANAVAPLAGTATGALGSGLLVQYAPAPTVLVYVLLAATFVAQAIGVLVIAETSPRVPGALASLRPHVRLPAAARGAFVVAVPALVAAWALAGLYGSLGPALARELVGSSSRVLGGVPLFVLALAGAATVFGARDRDARALMRQGTASLAAGVALALTATALRSPLLFVLGAGVAGSGFGAAFQGAIRMVLPLASAAERAGTLAVIYIVSYLAFGAPAVAAGVDVAARHDVVGTATIYGLAVIALALAALAGTYARAAGVIRESAR